MSRPRSTIAQLMTLILLIGFGFAALRNANDYWASATFTLAMISILVAPLGAFARKGKARITWAGFAVFGWAYLLVDLLPDRSPRTFGIAPIPWPGLIIDAGAALLQPYIHPWVPGVSDWLEYDQVSHSLGIMLFGLVGAVIGRYVASRDDQPNP